MDFYPKMTNYSCTTPPPPPPDNERSHKKKFPTTPLIKIHSRMHTIELFFKKISRKSIYPLAMKWNSAVYTPYERQRKRDVLQYIPLSKKIPPQCLNIDLYPPPPPPPDKDRVNVTIMPC